MATPTDRLHGSRTATPTTGGKVMPAVDARVLAPGLHWRAPMTTHTLSTLSSDQLSNAHGGLSAGEIPDAARWIMMHESGGSTTAGHLHAQGRGDGTPGNHSSAFGAFQMIKATRKQYMGADYESTDFGKQYNAASRYVRDRYGSWDGAKQFWQSHRWY